MNTQILVAYATKHGATAGIAERIGLVLQRSGLIVDVRSVEDVDDVEIYQAVVLGSAVYVGRWRREAVRFLEAYAEALSTRPVWLFSSGPTGEGDPAALLEGWQLPDILAPFVDQIQPRSIALFHGAIQIQQLNLAERMIVKALQVPVGDYRDWDAIESWATEIAAALR